jgi:lysophospholipase L1-like esterase
MSFLTDPNRGLNTAVINLAAPLRSLIDIEQDFPSNAEKYAGPEHERISVFMVGMAESQKSNTTGEYALEPEAFQSSLKRVSHMSHEFGYQPIFLGMTPINDERARFRHIHFETQARTHYDAIIRDTAEEAGDTYIDIAKEFSERFPDPEKILDRDGLHVNALGHAAIHEILLPVVLEALHQQRHS